jgi:tetratricopeptide (TPR) repeat protein
MSLIHEPRVYRIRALQRAYSALQQELPFLEERVYLLRDVVAEPVSFAFHPSELTLVSIAEQQCDLGAALLERYMHLRERKDLDEAEPHLRTALQDLPLGHPRARCSSLLGSVLRECAFETKSTQMAGEALVIHRSLYADHIRPGVPAFDRAYHSRELGSTLHIYFQINKAKANLHTLFESLERLNEAHAIFAAREARAADHITLLTLCEVLLFLFGSQPNADKVYIEGSVAHGEHALATCGATHRDIFEITRKLARARAFLGFYSGDMGSVSIGIDLFRQALASAPSRWATLLSLPLTDTLLARYESQGHEEDLAEALVAGSVLAVTLKPGVEGWGKLQECLCRMRRYQFDITGRPEDIEAAASAANLACACTAVGTTAHLHRLVQLALCQLQQYNAFGDVTCLDECSKILELVMQLGAMQSRYWNEAARLLLRVYYLRYSEQPARDITDIRRAIALRSTMDPGNDVETRPDLLRYVGNILCAHFEATGALEDLEQATALLEEAASHSSHYTGHDIMQTYATVLRVRYEALHEAKSIVKALLIQEEALEALPEVHPDRAPALCGLAHLQLWASTTQGHASDALDHILGALNSHYCPAYRRLKSVSAILTSPYLAAHMPVLSDDNALKLCVVYSTVIDLLPQVASFGLGPRARLAVISSAGQLTIQGATHAISIGRFDQALEMLEAGRNVFWTQGLRLRTPFTDLPKTIGDRLTTISYALSRPPPEGADKGHELIRRRKLGDEFQSVLAEARLEPGFHDLLRNASFDSLARAAQHHPIIVFVAGEAYGHALIILGHGDCRHVPLQQATTKALQAISIHIQAHIDNIRSQRGIRRVAVTNNRPTDVYRKLWTLVMRPVLEALHWDVSTTHIRHPIWTYPTHSVPKGDSVVDWPSALPACSCACPFMQPASILAKTKCAVPTTSWRRTLRPSGRFSMPSSHSGPCADPPTRRRWSWLWISRAKAFRFPRPSRRRTSFESTSRRPRLSKCQPQMACSSTSRQPRSSISPVMVLRICLTHSKAASIWRTACSPSRS